MMFKFESVCGGILSEKLKIEYFKMLWPYNSVKGTREAL